MDALPVYSASIGYLITTFNDLCNSVEMWPSFREAIPVGDVWAVTVVDGGSQDGSIDWWSKHIAVIHPNMSDSKHSVKDFLGGREPEDLKHLSVALNVGIDYLKQKGAQYICWIHTDMKFPEEGWANKLSRRLAVDSELGKASPLWLIEKGKFERDHAYHEGNSCPWVIPIGVFDQIAEKREEIHGEECSKCERANVCPRWFCEKFIGIGGREDWDVNKIIMECGLKCAIFHDVFVDHEGEGTRKMRDTTLEQYHNGDIY